MNRVTGKYGTASSSLIFVEFGGEEEERGIHNKDVKTCWLQSFQI